MIRSMKIGLVLPYNIFLGGGVKEYVMALQAEMIRRGHQALVITPQPRGHKDDAPEGVIFLGGSTNFKSPFATTAQLSVTVNTDRVDEVLAEEQFDILHFHEPWVPIIGRQILTRSSSVNVATFHAKLPDTILSRTIERVVTPYTRSITKYLDVLTAVSEPAATYIQQLTDKPLVLIPNGIDLEKYAPPKKRPINEHPTILYVGRLEKRKGVKYLILAFSQLVAEMPDARLLIGGDGSDRDDLEQLVQDYEIPNIEFLGYLEEDEKIKLLQTCDVFCAPSLYGESFGIVLLESISCGIPTVAGDNPGYSYVLQDRGAIGLVDPKNTDDFCRTLKLMLTDETLRAAWREWAAEYKQQFDYTRIGEHYERVYQEALKAKH
ncbi:hypothetical protein CR970_01520 [Candidatus Saccharibacteria bacterium]|nr:MAG: hypothetical protein CR970_01520 [Candidatus Saccharibacteria bacterium]